MTVNSLLSFSVAAYSGRRIIANWTNPNQAAGRPYSGVIIRYDTGGYPGTTGGVQIYKGAGNNHSAGAVSQAFLDLPNLNARYFLSCTPYVTTSFGELLGNPINAEVTTGGGISRTFTYTQNFTIPDGYTRADIFCVGGGGNGGNVKRDASSTNPYEGGSGGGGGYTTTVINVSVTPIYTFGYYWRTIGCLFVWDFMFRCWWSNSGRSGHHRFRNRWKWRFRRRSNVNVEP